MDDMDRGAPDGDPAEAEEIVTRRQMVLPLMENLQSSQVGYPMHAGKCGTRCVMGNNINSAGGLTADNGATHITLDGDRRDVYDTPGEEW